MAKCPRQTPLKIHAIVCFLFAGMTAAAQQGTLQEKATAGLLRALEQNNRAVKCLVYFKDGVELGGAATLASKPDKTRYVYDRLRGQALRSQARVRSMLSQEGVTFRPHYLLNAVEMDGDSNLLGQVAAFAEVEGIREVVGVRQQLPVPSAAPTRRAEMSQAIEWGVARVRAPLAWTAYGTRGEGIVVAVADTGMQWDHPALKTHYRGWSSGTVSHDYSWHDAIHDSFNNPCGNNSPFPCDDSRYGHGTHVTGIIVGDDAAGNQIGVAPGAKWIGCRNMDQDVGTIPRYAECMEFFLAPYPQNGSPLDGRPDLAADIVSNSWACIPSEGCDTAHLKDLQTVVQRLETAGILVVAAAGNNGNTWPYCRTVQEPLALYPETLTVGATQSDDNAAYFSSRGPVTIDGSNIRKPDIAAPGVGVRSSVPGNIYGLMSGTSQATPHVAGVAALLWSVVPGYRGNPVLTKRVLQFSADPRTTSDGCGGDSAVAVPNNTYGYGIVNAVSAIEYSRRVRLPLLAK